MLATTLKLGQALFLAQRISLRVAQIRNWILWNLDLSMAWDIFLTSKQKYVRNIQK